MGGRYRVTAAFSYVSCIILGLFEAIVPKLALGTIFVSLEEAHHAASMFSLARCLVFLSIQARS